MNGDNFRSQCCSKTSQSKKVDKGAQLVVIQRRDSKAKKGDEKGAKIEEKKVWLRIVHDILCCDRIGRGEMTSCMPSSHL